jgi:hypothetical protein
VGAADVGVGCEVVVRFGVGLLQLVNKIAHNTTIRARNMRMILRHGFAIYRGFRIVTPRS